MKEEGITRKKRGGRRIRRKRGGKGRRTEKDEGGGRRGRSRTINWNYQPCCYTLLENTGRHREEVQCSGGSFHPSFFFFYAMFQIARKNIR